MKSTSMDANATMTTITPKKYSCAEVCDVRCSHACSVHNTNSMQKLRQRNRSEILMAFYMYMEDAKQNRLLSKRTREYTQHIQKKNAQNNKTEKQISDKIGKLLTFPINVGSFIIKPRYEFFWFSVSLCLSFSCTFGGVQQHCADLMFVGASFFWFSFRRIFV